MTMRPLLYLLLPLAACAAPPDLGLSDQDGPEPPALVPLDTILAAAEAGTAPDDTLAARATALMGRAQALREVQ